MKQGRKIFWGVMFILGALALLVIKLGYLEGIGFWSILFTIALFGILVDGIMDRGYGRILFSAAFLIIIYDELLGMEAITPWPVLGAALLGTIGLGILFPKKYKIKAKKHGNNQDTRAVDEDDVLSGEEIGFSNTFGEAVKYLGGSEISQVTLENTFGSLSVYFNNAVLKGGVAEVSVENTFGSTVLYVPGDWKVVMNVNTVFGEADEKGRCNPMGNHTLHISGKVTFGELEIRYI